MSYRRRPRVIDITPEELDERIASLQAELEEVRNARDIYAVADDLSSCLFLRDGKNVSADSLIYGAAHEGQ